jgi:hypothetical protein
MSDWRAEVLEPFIPEAARLFAVADPDGLLTEPTVYEALEDRGFDLLTCEDPVAFRHTYETTYRNRWPEARATGSGAEDHGAPPPLVVRTARPDVRALPYDVLAAAGRRLTLRLGDLFPLLNLPVVRTLDTADWGALHAAQETHLRRARGRVRSLSTSATKAFALRHVFGIDVEGIREASTLLNVLLRRHYDQQRIPALLEAHLIERLQEHGDFAAWPLRDIVTDAQAFYTFLQERWPEFVRREDPRKQGTAESAPPSVYSGPRHLPFGHVKVRPYVDSLFLEGLLDPLDHDATPALKKSWMRVGLRTGEAPSRQRRYERLLETLAEDVPPEGDRHDAWQRFAPRWARLCVLRHQVELPTDADDPPGAAFEALRSEVDAAFEAWLRRHYGGLHNIPPTSPVMLHHVPQMLARQLREDAEKRVALVVLDGCSLSQWHVLRRVLIEQQTGRWTFRESAVFAWLPTLTSISRQSIFAGGPPRTFPESLHRTGKEQHLWRRFWQQEGFSFEEVTYKKVSGDPQDAETLRAAASDERVRALGMVVGKVDDIMHGMTMGEAGMLSQVRQWGEEGFLQRLLGTLVQSGYSVHLTSDHGNVEATGIGRPSEGATAEQRGQRARIYDRESLRASVQEAFPDATAWPPLGLPDDCFPLLAPARRAFAYEGERTVAHGGASVEEVMVPLVSLNPS